MLKVTFGDGTPFSADEAMRRLKEDIARETPESFAAAIRGEKCPTHGEEIVVTNKTESFDKMGIELSGCCDEFVRAMAAKLGAQEVG